MKKEMYIVATATELAETLLRQGINKEICFALCFEKDENECINEDSPEDWWGAVLIKLFDGYCLLIGQLGGGKWYSYDVANDNGLPSLRMLHSAFSTAMRWEFEKTEVCLGTAVAGLVCRRCKSPVFKSSIPEEYAYQCFVCDEDLYTFEVESVKQNKSRRRMKNETYRRRFKKSRRIQRK